MKQLIHKPATKAEWLGLRLEDVTATEAAALFGASPYCTPFKLWHQKKNQEIDELEDNDRMLWGRRLERTIAEGICEDNGWEIVNPEHQGAYFRHVKCRMGATPDFFIMCPERGLGILEIKNVDWFVHNDKWEDDEAPAHIEIQLQDQLHVTGSTWGAVGYLKGGNDAGVFIRDYDVEMCKAIEQKVNEFWESIEKDEVPPADYHDDADFLIEMYSKDDGTDVDMMENESFSTLCADYFDVNSVRKEAEKEEKALKAEILEAVGDHAKAFTAGFNVSAKRSKDGVDKVFVVEHGDDGEIIVNDGKDSIIVLQGESATVVKSKGRSGSRRLLIKEND